MNTDQLLGRASTGDEVSKEIVFEYLAGLEQKEEQTLLKIRRVISSIAGRDFLQKSTGIATFRPAKRKTTLTLLKLFRSLLEGDADAENELADYIYELEATTKRLEDIVRNFHQLFDMQSFILKYPDTSREI